MELWKVCNYIRANSPPDEVSEENLKSKAFKHCNDSDWFVLKSVSYDGVYQYLANTTKVLDSNIMEDMEKLKLKYNKLDEKKVSMEVFWFNAILIKIIDY